jgi:hypothetical protein
MFSTNASLPALLLAPMPAQAAGAAQHGGMLLHDMRWHLDANPAQPASVGAALTEAACSPFQ